MQPGDKGSAALQAVWREAEAERTRRVRRRRRLLSLLAVGVLAGAAAWSYFGPFRALRLPFGLTPIPDVVAAPARFEAREITVRGVVSGTGELRLSNGGRQRFYALSEDGAELVVVTQGTLPARGQSLVVTGTVTRPPPGQGLAPRLAERQRERVAAR